MTIYVEITGTLSFGKLAGRDYQLVCHGEVEDFRTIQLRPVTYFLEPSSLQRSIRPFLQTSVLLADPLFVQTIIDVNVMKDTFEWQARLIIDLKDWLFYIEDLDKHYYMPNEVKRLLFSSFSIQIGNKALTLEVLASRKHIESGLS